MSNVGHLIVQQLKRRASSCMEMKQREKLDKMHEKPDSENQESGDKECESIKKDKNLKLVLKSAFGKYREFVRENEILIQAIIILPVVFMGLYIVFIEKGSIIKYKR